MDKTKPRWIKAKFPARCKSCDGKIKVGDNCIYFADTKTLYCGDWSCGQMGTAVWDIAEAHRYLGYETLKK